MAAIAGGAGMLATSVLFALAGVLRSPGCTIDSVFERSGHAALLATMLGGALLILAGWRRSGRLTIIGLTLPVLALAVHLICLPGHDRREQQCRQRSLAQALGQCGETRNRYLIIRSSSGGAELTPKPGVPTDARSICLARWAQWGKGVVWSDAEGFAQ